MGKPRPRELVRIRSSGPTLHSISFDLSVRPSVKGWECQNQQAKKQRKWNYQSAYTRRKAGQQITELLPLSLSWEGEVVASGRPSLRDAFRSSTGMCACTRARTHTQFLLLFSVSFVFVLSFPLLFPGRVLNFLPAAAFFTLFEEHGPIQEANGFFFPFRGILSADKFL